MYESRICCCFLRSRDGTLLLYTISFYSKFKGKATGNRFLIEKSHFAQIFLIEIVHTNQTKKDNGDTAVSPLCRSSYFFEFVHDTVSDRFACGIEDVGILGEFEDFGRYFFHIFENRVTSDLILEHLHVLEILDAVADIFKLGRTYGTLFLLTEKRFPRRSHISFSSRDSTRLPSSRGFRQH